ncbi:response regulator [Sulfitobacter sp. HNIBRBA3233]|uniref:response regulator n=1 Tax=Sulfitobacter marinivivus TaxID=3158558 RepID=UPI0032DE3C3F
MSLFQTPSPTPRQAAEGLPDIARVLVVEDQRFDRMRILRMCRALDLRTELTEASTLAGMVQQLGRQRFDLVLLDYHLPDGTGLQGVEMIREDFINRHAATVMITGTTETRIAGEALKLGFSDYVTKEELSARTLRRAMISALQKSGLVTGLESTGTAMRETHATLHRFSRECAGEIKPIVSRMMRQLREIKHGPPEASRSRVEELEASCDRLWSFLEDLQNFGDVAARPSVRPRSQAPRPPSPFTRRMN